MSCPFDFCERNERPFFNIFGSLSYSSLHPFFYVTYLHALIRVDHHSLFYLFVFFYLYFIPQFYLFSSNFFIFSSCLVFDLGSSSILYSCLFDMSIPLSSLFRVGMLRSATHDVFYALHLMHKGYGDYIIGIIEPSFLSFLFISFTLLP